MQPHNCFLLCYSAWPTEEDNVVLDKLTRRVEHIMGLLAASNKRQSDNFMVRASYLEDI